MVRKVPHLVIAEDDEFVQRLLAAYFERENFRVTLVQSGEGLLETVDGEPVDCILLDLGLPDEDGLVLMRQIRARCAIPVIVLTARLERDSRIAALELGADDYLTKPCDPEELVLRVRNLLSRSGSGPSSSVAVPPPQVLGFADWSMNIEARTLTRPDGEEEHLSRSEFNLLAALAQSSNRVLSRAQLLDAIRQSDKTQSERLIDVLVARLRRKLEKNPRKPELIRTVVGVGYKFAARVTKSIG